MSGIHLALMGGSFGAAPGQQAYTTAGTYTWVAPAGVTSVSVVAVGSGGAGIGFSFGGSGAGLGYKNNYPVTPGSSYTVVVGNFANSTPGAYCGQDSYFVSTSVVKGGKGFFGSNAAGGTYTGDGGGNGGRSGTPLNCCTRYGGGGAGGYSGNGGNAGNSCNGYVGQNGSGGGGAGGDSNSSAPSRGGGVGILGQGSSGTAPSGAGSGGSGVTYGGGGSGDNGLSGGGGAVRIIWPGTSRQFPSTNTGNL